MKTFNRVVLSATILLGSLCLMAGTVRGQSVPFSVALYYPTNNQAFGAPANIYMHARVTDSNLIQTVQFFSGATSLGWVTNSGGLLFTNTTQSNPFFIVWSNITAGAYALTAVVRDNAGNQATSAPVNITVTNPVVRPSVYIYSPANGAMFLTPANLTLYARAGESAGTVATVQFFANNASLGVVSNSSQMVFTNISTEPLFPLAWSNVLTGSYALKAVATDTHGNSATSSVVNIYVVTNIPPVIVRPLVGIYSPATGATYLAPTNVNIYARAVESNGLVATVQFFANSLSLGVVSNSSQVIVSNISTALLFPLTWSNPPAGSYALKALATDTNGNTATSSVVNITIVTNLPPPNVPFAISFWYPSNGQAFLAPANIGVHALVVDSNVVRTVQYFSGTTSIGIVSNTSNVLLTNSTQSNPFYLTWSNVLAGSYSLTALATDSAGHTATSAPVNITVTNQPPPNIPFAVGFWYPTNGQTFTAPANVGVHALVVDSNVVQTMQYFANGSSIGTVTNSSGVLLTNTSQANPFFFSWSNVLAGSYALTAVAKDSAGNTATSAPVNIIVTNLPPPVIHPSVGIYSPANGASYLAPATVKIYARAYESTGMVAIVEFFENSVSLGVVPNSSQIIVSNISTAFLYPLTWSNVPAGSYALKVVATDTNGNTGTSSVVYISVVTNYPPPPNVPFAVSFWYPTNGQMFAAPANIGVHARVTDSNVVQTVQYFANGSSIGTVTNSGGVLLTNSTQGNPFFLSWSNVPAGSYALTALATDSAGNTASSAPVNIYVLTNLPPVINIYAPDPVAIEGTNYLNWYSPTSSTSNYVSGANTATFLVHRDSYTNTDLTVYYSIGGTAFNGEDYATLPGVVTIPAGRSYALIIIYPLDDTDSSYRLYDTVVLSLLVPPTASNSPAAYRIGSPQQAGAIILEENFLPIPQPVIRSLDDSSLHVSLPATNGMNFCLQISTDLLNWLPVCTNTVLKGSAQFVDPSGTGGTGLFYRIVPVATPASY